MNSCILAIDQGTTSTRTILFDRQGRAQGSAQQEFAQHFPHGGWVEHEVADLWRTTLETAQQALSTQPLGADAVAAISITNQRETTVVWDRHSGEPVYRAIVWQDRRTSDYCQQLRAQGLDDMIQARTGLLLDPYFSASKLRWILENVPGARQRAEAGDLLFGTVDSYLIWKLTGGRRHCTDATNASRTCLFNIHQQCWDADLLALFEIPANMMPEVLDCCADFGCTDAALLGRAIPIAGVAGDQQAALVGQACFQPGMVKSTYGTGCFMIMNTGEQPRKSNNRLLTTVAYRLNGKVTYAMEGSIFVAGAAVQWMRDGLKLFGSSADTEALARQTGVGHGVYLVPAFTGLGAPHWDPQARGAIFGLTRGTGIAEIVAAGLQSVCYQTRDLQECMLADTGEKTATLRVDGGMVSNDWVMQFLADILDVQVDRPDILETTALGSAYLAGLHIGWFEHLEDITQLWRCRQSFIPQMAEEERQSLYQGWLEAVQRVRSPAVS